MKFLGAYVWVLWMACLHAYPPVPPSAVLRPGALVSQTGNVLLVEDVVTVRIMMFNVHKVHPAVSTLRTKLNQVSVAVNDLVAEQPHFVESSASGESGTSEVFSILKIQSQRIQLLLSKIDKAFGVRPSGNHSLPVVGPTEVRRTTRGLLDVVGTLMQGLFGTALDKDVQGLKSHIEYLTSLSNSQNTVLEQQYHLFSKVRTDITAVVSSLNFISMKITSMRNRENLLEKVLFITEVITVVERQADNMIDNCQVVIEDILEARIGQVNSRLLPLPMLKAALDNARDKLNLIPVLSSDLIQYYYPLLDVHVSGQVILIHIPMRSKDQFQAMAVFPFPMIYGEDIVSLVGNDRLVLVSEDLRLVASTNDLELKKCRSVIPKVFLCVAKMFSFKGADNAQCELELMKSDAKKVHEYCIYQRLSWQTMYNTHVAGFNYFFF